MKKLAPLEQWILLGVPVLFLISPPLHFLFDWTGKLPVIGAFTPVNESVWEHIKLAVFPIALWWGGYFVFEQKKQKINSGQWFFGCLVSLLFNLLFIPIFFYTYTGAFGFDSIILDIFSLFLALLFGQRLGLYCYKKGKSLRPYLSVTLIFIILLLFVIFTFFPPQIPLFSSSGVYGMK